ncbi:hypothetical protein ATI61_1403 [Archangium gephyra]|uniref:Lipoprotein n=1 Tax=Archangium gephyra TaxID=48 RepID=A0AAC8QJ01_9BACT|nr:hypothetical protein [Archangium gephyra]AKJ08365.1 Hypothetical protein AA314_09991 [Archangium gephyra]REG14186.1 hypothetical protein ATI61_1403 [Archangium gephyra]
MKKLTLIAGVLTLVLAGCGPIESEAADTGSESPGTATAALTTYGECCSAIPNSGYTEAFCDSVAYSPGRCNQVWGGTACQWNTTNCPVTCCQPKSGSTVSWNYCNSYAISADRCNAVNGGTTCNWTC